jgi:hypothetical protein
VVDVRESDLTKCTPDSQCVLRSGTGCCEGCGSGGWIAVRNDGSFGDWACNGQEVPCDACIALPPAFMTARCGASGHCETVMMYP